jgi:hypothetical protein
MKLVRLVTMNLALATTTLPALADAYASSAQGCFDAGYGRAVQQTSGDHKGEFRCFTCMSRPTTHADNPAVFPVDLLDDLASGADRTVAGNLTTVETPIGSFALMLGSDAQGEFVTVTFKGEAGGTFRRERMSTDDMLIDTLQGSTHASHRGVARARKFGYYRGVIDAPIRMLADAGVVVTKASAEPVFRGAAEAPPMLRASESSGNADASTAKRRQETAARMMVLRSRVEQAVEAEAARFASRTKGTDNAGSDKPGLPKDWGRFWACWWARDLEGDDHSFTGGCWSRYMSPVVPGFTPSKETAQLIADTDEQLSLLQRELVKTAQSQR